VKVLTNNPMVHGHLSSQAVCAVDYRDVSLHELMCIVRDFVHLGHRLLTHPLSGSVKPNETLYKSIGITDQPEAGLCLSSLNIIEHSIQTVERFANIKKPIDSNAKADLQLVDFTLILSALDSFMPGQQTFEALKHPAVSPLDPPAPTRL